MGLNLEPFSTNGQASEVKPDSPVPQALVLSDNHSSGTSAQLVHDATGVQYASELTATPEPLRLSRLLHHGATDSRVDHASKPTQVQACKTSGAGKECCHLCLLARQHTCTGVQTGTQKVAACPTGAKRALQSRFVTGDKKKRPPDKPFGISRIPTRACKRSPRSLYPYKQRRRSPDVYDPLISQFTATTERDTVPASRGLRCAVNKELRTLRTASAHALRQRVHTLAQLPSHGFWLFHKPSCNSMALEDWEVVRSMPKTAAESIWHKGQIPDSCQHLCQGRVCIADTSLQIFLVPRPQNVVMLDFCLDKPQSCAPAAEAAGGFPIIAAKRARLSRSSTDASSSDCLSSAGHVDSNTSICALDLPSANISGTMSSEHFGNDACYVLLMSLIKCCVVHLFVYSLPQLHTAQSWCPAGMLYSCDYHKAQACDCSRLLMQSQVVATF
jgi:hypothetical protein